MNLYQLQRFNNNKNIIIYLYVIISGYLVNVCLSKILTNSYLVEFHHETDRALADQIAARNGFINAGPVINKIFFFFLRKKLNLFENNMFPLNLNRLHFNCKKLSYLSLHKLDHAMRLFNAGAN